MIAGDLGNVQEAQLRCAIGDSFSIAKENDFGARGEQRPTAKSVALNHGDVAAKGLGRSHDSKHAVLKPVNARRIAPNDVPETS